MQFAEAFKLALQSLWGEQDAHHPDADRRGDGRGVGDHGDHAGERREQVRGHQAVRVWGGCVHGEPRGPLILSAEDYFKYQKRKILRFEDYEAVRDNCTECSEVGAMLNKSTNVVFNGHSSNNTEGSRLHLEHAVAEQRGHRAGARIYAGGRRTRRPIT